jgi:hypothetical protein
MVNDGFENWDQPDKFGRNKADEHRPAAEQNKPPTRSFGSGPFSAPVFFSFSFGKYFGLTKSILLS